MIKAGIRRLQAAPPWQQRQPGYAGRWLDIAQARAGGVADPIDVRPRVELDAFAPCRFVGAHDVPPRA